MICQLLFWNICGIRSSQRRLSKLVRKLHLNFIMLAKPFVDDSNLAVLKNSLNFEHGFSNQCVGGKLWLIWREGSKISVSNYSDQHVTVLIKMESRFFMVSVVYAKCNHLDRRDL